MISVYSQGVHMNDKITGVEICYQGLIKRAQVNEISTD